MGPGTQWERTQIGQTSFGVGYGSAQNQLERGMTQDEIAQWQRKVQEEWEQRAHQLPRPYKLPRKRLARYGA